MELTSHVGDVISEESRERAKGEKREIAKSKK